MAQYPGWKVRDQLASHFRFSLMSRAEIVPWFHQAQVLAYLDQIDLAREASFSATDIPQYGNTPKLRVQIEHRTYWLIATPVFKPVTFMKYGEKTEEPFPTYYESGEPILALEYHEVKPSDRPRPRVLTSSGSFKQGKSVLGGIITASFAICPNLRWDFWGMEYENAEPELDSTYELLLGEGGPAQKRTKINNSNELFGWTRYKCDPKMGRMYLELSNGARFGGHSVRRATETKSDPLKGKERDGYTLGEVFLFPSVQTIMGYNQNLARRNGYWIMPSTPDRPIMDDINKRADPKNEEHPRWLGVQNVHRRENPYGFVAEDYFEELGIFSKQKFTVYWEGKTGRWIGAVYPPVQYFDTTTHPFLWDDPKGLPTIENFKPPGWFKRVAGADTGTLFSGVSALTDDSANIFFIGEFGNYRYISGEIEKEDEITVASLCSEFKSFNNSIGGVWIYYTDPNSQWKDEWRRHGIPLRSGRRLPERRCEVARGFAQNELLWFAPWLRESELVFEYEYAKYPDLSSTKREKRVDGNDHKLDALEHICAMHPRANKPVDDERLNPVMRMLQRKKKEWPQDGDGDPMMGVG